MELLLALSGVDYLTRLDEPAAVQAPQQITPLIAPAPHRRRGAPAGDNPWQATTLEWQPTRGPVHVERGPYEYHSGTTEADFTPQWETASQQE